jgi:hypothetical protein
MVSAAIVAAVRRDWIKTGKRPGVGILVGVEGDPRAGSEES